MRNSRIAVAAFLARRTANHLRGLGERE